MNEAYQSFKGKKPTSPDIEGPFYLPDAPFRNDLGAADLSLSGVVTGVDGAPVPGCLLDFWQADGYGNYDEKGPGFRGRQHAGPDGAYALYTVRPGDYPIGPGEFRCAHIHVKLSAAGFRPLTTQLYFADDPYNATDHWFSADRVIGPDGRFDFVLERE